MTAAAPTCLEPCTVPLGADRSRAVLDTRALHLRQLIVRALEGGGRGHIGSSVSPLEIIRVLYDDILRFRTDAPDWPDRDRFILSKGHGCLALYAVLADKGFFPITALDDFCRFDGSLGGHPEHGKVPGVEASTGALGHGLPIAVGMALAARVQGRASRVFTVLGDGELDEGSVWEAALSAGKHRLASLTVLVDYNKLQSAGPVDEIQPLEPLADKWRAFGFHAIEVDGHDVAALRQILAALPLNPDLPTAIICHTIKGRGFDFAEGRADWHHKARLSPDDLARLRQALA